MVRSEACASAYVELLMQTNVFASMDTGRSAYTCLFDTYRTEGPHFCFHCAKTVVEQDRLVQMRRNTYCEVTEIFDGMLLHSPHWNSPASHRLLTLCVPNSIEHSV
jgi:hypothetical protein